MEQSLESRHHTRPSRDKSAVASRSANERSKAPVSGRRALASGAGQHENKSASESEGKDSEETLDSFRECLLH
jgi:hypothetical protein